MLAFVPEDEVVPSIISLLEHIPEELGFDDFLDQFESAWIQSKYRLLEEQALPASLLLLGTVSTGRSVTSTEPTPPWTSSTGLSLRG